MTVDQTPPPGGEEGNIEDDGQHILGEKDSHVVREIFAIKIFEKNSGEQQRRGKTNAGESASNQNGGVSPAQAEERTQVFSFAGLRNTIGREGLSLDGVKANSKMSYPA